MARVTVKPNNVTWIQVNDQQAEVDSQKGRMLLRQLSERPQPVLVTFIDLRE